MNTFLYFSIFNNLNKFSKFGKIKMQKSPLCNARRRSVTSHANASNAATEWFHRKFGDAIQLSERRKKLENARKQNAISYSEVKKDLEKCLSVRRHEQLERRYNFYNAENELFEEEEAESGEEERREEEMAKGELVEEKEGEEEDNELDEEELEEEEGYEKNEENERDEGETLEGDEEEGESEGDERETLEGDEEEGESEGDEGETLEGDEEEIMEEREEMGYEKEADDDSAVEDDNEETSVEKEEGEQEEEEGKESLDKEEPEDKEKGDEEEKKDYESGDEGIELVRRKVREEEPQMDADNETVKKKLIDLFDDEASLSGEDVGSDSGDESLDGPDEYEAEEGDLDQLPDSEEIRENLVRQFLKHQNDDSDRRLLRLQEAFFADSDLHGQGGSGDRSFRFRMHADANVDWAKLLGTIDEGNEDEHGEEQRHGEDEWHQRRLQMVKWRAEEEERKRRARKRTREDDEEETSGERDQTERCDKMDTIAEPVELDSPLFTLGKRVLWSGGNKGVTGAVPPCPGPSSASLVPPSAFSAVPPFTPPPKRRDSLLFSAAVTSHILPSVGRLPLAKSDGNFHETNSHL